MTEKFKKKQESYVHLQEEKELLYLQMRWVMYTYRNSQTHKGVNVYLQESQNKGVIGTHKNRVNLWTNR